ncbi:MAG: preprotein translocase subunit YajC [Bacteroidetes bacterium]|nr:MAG: preprotein translocase subunit YajC [Bacteroidota bacterium]
MNLLNIMLMTQPEGGEGNPYQGIIMMVLIIGVFYFFFIRPQQKKAKDAVKMRDALKKGDKIVTVGGIHGKIIEMADTTFTIEVEGQSRLKINRDAVSPSGDTTVGQKK